MKKIRNIIIYCVLSIIVYVFIREIFFERIITSKIHFQVLNQYENRSDILTLVSIISTSFFSYLMYRLSSRIGEQNNIVQKNDRYKSICSVYDYLMEVINYTKKKTFNEKEDYSILKYDEKFMQSVYNLNNDVLTEDDLEILRDLNLHIKNYTYNIQEKISNGQLSLKWLYKCLFDMNINFEQVHEMSCITNLELILSFPILYIIEKLKKEIGYRIEENISYKNIKLTISIKKSITIKKEYDDICSIINGKGYIKKYEPIFYTNKPHINGNIVYEGQVEKNIPSGDGTYYYHTSKTQNNELNSNDLIDSNAQKITKILINNGKSTNIEAKAIGKFVDGIIIDGFIESKEFNEKISINEGSDLNG